MIQVTVITVGNLKEAYWRDAMAEYKKRLCAFCKPEIVQLKETKLPENPSEGEIKTALADEAKRILAAMPSRSYKIALCVEGTQFSSEALAQKLEGVLKRACDLRLSVSKLTFPHQMMRVLLLEVLYRCFGILKGTKYHK